MQLGIALPPANISITILALP